MAEAQVFTDDQVLKAVEDYAYRRYHHLTLNNIQQDWDDEELDRISTTDGYLNFTIEDLNIAERKDSADGPTWYVEATLFFLVNDGGENIEGSTDTYECYRCGDEWCIDWHSS